MASKGVLINGRYVIGGTLSSDQKLSKFPEKIIPGHELRLYATLSCPYAQSTAIAHLLKNNTIPVTLTDIVQGDQGWNFSSEHPDSTFNFNWLHQLYTHTDSQYTGRVTTPVLMDMTEKKAVSNESWNIMEILNTHPDSKSSINLFPSELASSGLTDQSVISFYTELFTIMRSNDPQVKEVSAKKISTRLNEIDHMVESKKFILGDQISALDIRLFVFGIRTEILCTLLSVNIEKKFSEYKNINSFLRRFYELPGIKEVTPLDDILRALIENPGYNPNNLKTAFTASFLSA